MERRPVLLHACRDSARDTLRGLFENAPKLELTGKSTCGARQTVHPFKRKLAALATAPWHSLLTETERLQHDYQT